MNIWKPDTCHCIINTDGDTFIQQCKTHDRPSETHTHNHSFKRENQIEDRKKERDKDKFQRRSL